MSMWVVVQTVDGRRQRLSMPPDWTVGDVKADLEEFDPETNDLVYKNRVVRDDETFNEIVSAEDSEHLFEVVVKKKRSHNEERGEPSVSSSLDIASIISPSRGTAESANVAEASPPARRKTGGDDVEKTSITLKFENGDKETVEAATVAEIKASARSFCRQRGLILDDILLDGSQSILQFGGKVLLKDVFPADVNDRTLNVLAVSHHPESSDESDGSIPVAAHNTRTNSTTRDADIFAEMLFDAQVEKERINHVNQMAYNSKVLTLSLLQLTDQVQKFFPSLQDELLTLVQHHNQATDLMRQALERNTMFRHTFNESSQTTGIDGSPLSRVHSPPAETFRLPQQAQGVPPARDGAAAPQQQQPQQPAAPNANARIWQPGGAGGVAARAPRAAALIVVDVRLLFKLALVVAVLGHDAGQTEFYIICLVAFLVYLANTNMLRIPFLGRVANMARIGRIPHAGRRGFFVDAWTMVSSFFLSIIPVWHVIAEDPPVDQQQVRPVAPDQPAVAAPVAL